MTSKTDSCPSYEDLVARHEGLASPAALERISSHLAGGCESCQAQLEWLAEMSAAFAETSAVELQAPEFMVEKALTLVRPPATRTAAPGT